MNWHERLYLLRSHGYPALHRIVRKRLLLMMQSCSADCQIVDIGGRKSPYTIGLPAAITVTDLPRESLIQQHLHLGLTGGVMNELKTRRSNVAAVLFDDMTKSHLPANCFDLATAVEVLEHVDDDSAFVRNTARVLKPDGVFLMTTPNGDFVPNNNPDHRRHYRRNQLMELLTRFFHEVAVEYVVPGGLAHRWSLRSWRLNRPARVALSFAGGVVSYGQTIWSPPSSSGDNRYHLLATAKSPRSEAR